MTTDLLEGYLGCQCGRHWWHHKSARWVTITTKGDKPVPLPTPGCCHVAKDDGQWRGDAICFTDASGKPIDNPWIVRPERMAQYEEAERCAITPEEAALLASVMLHRSIMYPPYPSELAIFQKLRRIAGEAP